MKQLLEQGERQAAAGAQSGSAGRDPVRAFVEQLRQGMRKPCTCCRRCLHAPEHGGRRRPAGTHSVLRLCFTNSSQGVIQQSADAVPAAAPGSGDPSTLTWHRLPKPALQAGEPAVAYDPPAAAAVPVEPSFDETEGRRDRQGRLLFHDHPEFRPNLTPKQVIQAGSFGG
jgi:hypothetical protein